MSGLKGMPSPQTCKSRKHTKNDTVLYADDVASVNGWLRDAVIDFYFEELQQQQTSIHQSKVTLLSPAIGQLWRHSPNPSPDLLHLLPHPLAPIICMPINDQTADGNYASGSHWSLLVLDRQKSDQIYAYYYDSILHSGNETIAHHFCQNTLAACFNIARDQILFRQMRSFPQQRNSSDCGVMVLEAIRQLWERIHLQNDSSLFRHNMEMDISDDRFWEVLTCDPAGMRRYLKSQVEKHSRSRTNNVT